MLAKCVTIRVLENMLYHEEAMRNINDYIINFYNSQSLPLTLGSVSPNNYETNMVMKQSSSVS